MQLLNRVNAIVTGGGTGIGKSIAERLNQEGANLIITGIDIVSSDSNQYGKKNIGGYTAAKEVVDSFANSSNKAIAVEADVTSESQTKKMIDIAVKEFGSVDLLVNCAGVVSFKKIESLTVKDWDHIIDVNLKGTYITNRASVLQMRRQGKGKIINFSSESGKKGEIGLTHYCASKWGVIGFTKALALEVAKENITVNAICPGVVGTQMWKKLSAELAEKGESIENSYKRLIETTYPQGVPQTGEDMAEAVVFLSISDHVTGIALSVDGGSTI